MRMLIDIYNVIAPLMSEICLAVLAIAWIPLLMSVLKKSADALIIFLYLNALYAGAQFALFTSPFDLMAFHWVLFATLLTAKIFTNTLKSAFNCGFMVLSVSLVILDQVAIMYGWLPHIHLLLVNLIFISMCAISGYYFWTSHENNGKRPREHETIVHFREGIRLPHR